MSRRIVVEEPCPACGRHGHLTILGIDEITSDCNGPGGSRTVLDGIPEEWVTAGALALFHQHPTEVDFDKMGYGYREDARAVLESVLGDPE